MPKSRSCLPNLKRKPPSVRDRARAILIPVLTAGCALWMWIHMIRPGSAEGSKEPAVTRSSDPDSRAHHTPRGYRNLDYPGEAAGDHGRIAFFRWQWERLWADLPRKVEGGWHPPVLQPDLAPFRARDPSPRLVWLGHDTFLMGIGGAVVMTDPHLTERASPVSFAGPRRLAPPPVALADLPHVDVVVISHNHYDHLDRRTVRALDRQPGGPPSFFVPLGLKAWMHEAGIETVTELDWWESAETNGLKLVLVPAQHFSGRTPFDTNRALWGGWIVDHPSFRFFHAGDTGYSPLFKEIGRRFAPIDLAALPIGAYEPRWFMGPVHANPEEAVRIHRDVGALRSVGMHWGTFQLTDEAPDEPPAMLAAALAKEGLSSTDFFVMQFGEALQLEPRNGRATAAAPQPTPLPVHAGRRPGR